MATSIKITTTISAPVKGVWDIFMDPNCLNEWLTGFISTEHLKGKIGQAGSESKLKFLERGKEMEVIERVLQVMPQQQYTFNMQHKSIESLVDVRFVSLGQNTELIQAVQFTPKGLFMKIMMPFMKGEMKKRMAVDLQKLKVFIEKQ